MLIKLLKSAATLAVVALLTVQLKPSVALSQCPTTMLPPLCNWIPGGGQMVVTVPGTTCQISAQYCYACCDGVSYFYLTQMQPQGPDCNTVDPKAMQDAVVQALFRSTAAFGCENPCPNGSNNVQIFTPGCWMMNIPTAPWQFTGCINGPFCKMTATVTCTNGVLSFSNCTSSVIGSGSCALGPGASGLWPTGQCLAVDCPPPPCP
jgi:hypothetical protein